MSKKPVRRLNDYAPADYNPRRITKSELDLLDKSLGRFGDLGGIVVNRRTGTVIGGHQRLKTFDSGAEVTVLHEYDEPTPAGTIAIGMFEHGGDQFFFREVDVDEQTEAAMNLAANKHGGEFDMGEVCEILSALDAEGFHDLTVTGWSDKELERLLVGSDPEHVDADAEVAYKSKWEIVVECDGEQMQESVFEKLRAEGYKCRVLTL